MASHPATHPAIGGDTGDTDAASASAAPSALEDETTGTATSSSRTPPTPPDDEDGRGPTIAAANDETVDPVVDDDQALESPSKRPRVSGAIDVSSSSSSLLSGGVVVVDVDVEGGGSGGGGESDSDVEILTPGRFPRRGEQPRPHDAGGGGGGADDDDEDDEVVVTSSNATNPNVDYPHSRHRCGVHPFVVVVGNTTTTNNNAAFCPRCYCYVCDAPALTCVAWADDHCHAHDGDERYARRRETTLNDRRGSTCTTTNDTTNTATTNTTTTNTVAIGGGTHHRQVLSLVHNEFLARLVSGGGNVAAGKTNDDDDDDERRRQQRTKERKDMRISEVLLENFRRSTILAGGERDATTTAAPVVVVVGANSKENTPPLLPPPPTTTTTSSPRHQRMEGDVPTLSLYNNFFVEGVKIGWPFPEVMKPQRQMAIHLVKALKNRRHVVLESPTGTGKSAAILCSVLAWQRHHLRMETMKVQRRGGDDDDATSRGRNGGEGGRDDEGGVADVRKVKIIYCSRTHSQVAQMVASLKSTPYRPRMAILGSRERLCIHKSIKPRGQGADAIIGVNVNNECRLRVRNTEKSRKHQLANPGSNQNGPYNDDDPPESMPGDGDLGGEQDVGTDVGPPSGEGEENQGYIRRSRTCPHYRQLTTSRVANLAHSTFVPNSKVDCCSVGGKQSKYGAHDIEDLVNFGVDPYTQRDIALYRGEATESFGLSLRGEVGRNGGSFVREVKRDTPADINGSIKIGDKIIRVNGTNVSSSNPATVVELIKQVKSDPLLLDISRGGSGTLSSLDDGYSSRSACPYYLSQILAKDADIVFAPYNYVLDPSIRKALGIDLDNSVVILDEAHNVESTLREAGSGKWGEFELCELIVMLNNYAITERSTGNMIDVGGDADILSKESETAYLCDVAHTLLMFVEKVVDKLRIDRTCFQNNPGKKGAANALIEWERFHTQDDNEFEVTFYGPTGKGANGQCIGCLPFFDNLGITKSDLVAICTYVGAFEKFVRGRDSNDGSSERDRISNLVDLLMDLVLKLNAAIQTPEHYYAAVLATANGNLEFAKNGDDGESESGGRTPKRKPRALPLIPPRTSAHPDRLANPCTNPFCRARCTDALNPVRHGEFCNGKTPRWQAHLHLDLLTPGPLMQELSNECRTIVLASGSLSPIPSLCAELNLFPADSPLSPVRPSEPDSTTSLPKVQKRLQNHPCPLEADHVVDLEKQLFAVSIGHFPDGSELRVAQKNYMHPEFLHKLGECLVRIVEGIVEGGVLVFLPSYSLLRKCERLWNPNSYHQNRRAWWLNEESSSDAGPSVFDRLKAKKHNVIVEPSGDQDAFEEKRQEYMETVRTKGGCVLLAVFRGKMSEGISFNDNNARGVVCVGVPLPSAFSLPIKVKMDYNEEQRKLRNRTDLLPGREWYNQQAYRAVAQALGRCIRHAADYGAIFLLDIRHCDDGSPNNGIPQAHKNLPKWMRHTVKNMSKHATGGNSMFNYASSSNTIWGGWPGLKTELHRFFRNAKPHANGVLKNQREKIAAASNSNVVHTFNVRTNKWSEENPNVPPTIPANSPLQSNGSNTSMDTTPNQMGHTTSMEVKNNSSSVINLNVSGGKSSRPSKSASIKKGTLQEMFKKQQDESGGSQNVSTSSSSKSKKIQNAPNTLRTMFEKQQAAATAASPTPAIEENMDVDEDEAVREQAPGDQPTAPQTNAPSVNSFSFERSPFANDNMLTPTSEVAAGTSQLQLAGTVDPARQEAEEDEYLCVVCEESKKQVILLPCKHMCLCKNCATVCLFKTLNECPMCRAKIEDSMEVFW